MIYKEMYDVANNLVNNSLKIKKGEKILIRAQYETKPLIKALIQEIGKKEAYPYVEIIDDELKKDQMLVGNDEMWATKAKWELEMYHDIDSLIVVRPRNDIEIGGANEGITSWSSQIQSARSYYINNKKWVLLTYPTELMAYKFNMSKDEFTSFWHKVSAFNYEVMENEAQKLKSLMEKTDKVRLVAPGTDLTFSIKDIPAIICAGQLNIPDGEVYTAPVADSVNGKISYNIPSSYYGAIHDDVVLEYKDGLLVKATSSHQDVIDRIFTSDDGAKRVGEFAIGINPFITTGTSDILFDEKMAGSIHFTPGASYDDASNGNHSTIHWDLVLSMRPEHGGGEIWFDDVLIRKDGQFVIDELSSLNEEELIKLTK